MFSDFPGSRLNRLSSTVRLTCSCKVTSFSIGCEPIEYHPTTSRVGNTSLSVTHSHHLVSALRSSRLLWIKHKHSHCPRRFSRKSESIFTISFPAGLSSEEDDDPTSGVSMFTSTAPPDPDPDADPDAAGFESKSSNVLMIDTSRPV
jgi:hypothetical protein